LRAAASAHASKSDINVPPIASSLLCVEMFCLGIMAGTGLHWLLGCRAWLSGLLEDAPPPMQATGDYIFGVGACLRGRELDETVWTRPDC
jgi:hypothetical protein